MRIVKAASYAEGLGHEGQVSGDASLEVIIIIIIINIKRTPPPPPVSYKNMYL